MKRILTALAAASAFGMAAPALAQSPATLGDNTPIALNGTIVSAGPNSFMLDYGDGLVTVEMDDFDGWSEASPLLEGDRVTVYGDVDNDLFQAARIEASSVYVKGLNTTFFANDADEEDLAAFYVVTPALNNVNVTGLVKQIDPAAGRIQLDTGQAMVTVETDELGYNPLDRYGYQRVALGDRLFVSGEVDRAFFQGRVLDAETIVTLNRAPRG